jgi:glycosyltransferase involved in cell wall biosynthesis
VRPGTSLGISGWRLFGQRTGVARYILSLVESFSSEIVGKLFETIDLYTPASLHAAGVTIPPTVRNRVLKSRLPMIPWDNIRLGPFAKDDVVLYPSFSRPFVARQATVVVTHDATMRIVPELYTRRDRYIYDPLYGWSAHAATLVITTSEAAKQDIVREWHVDPDKIRVTLLAAASAFHPLGPYDAREAIRQETIGCDTPYFMFVGKISGRRNIPELLRAFLAFQKSGYPHKLLIVGPTYAIDAVNAFADDVGVRGSLITRSNVTDDMLNRLYNGAEAFIMPSVYENGSLPVFEAQATATPVISVRTVGTEEISGGAALLIPELAHAPLVDAMTRIAGDAALRRELSERGLVNSRRYSWSRCARQTLEVCREAVEMQRR